jgi:hypothetical protein
VLRTLPVALFAVTAWAGCLGPQTPAAKANDAARELNVQSRFGDISSIVSMTAPAVRDEFLSRRAEWGRLIRVVDVDLANFTMLDTDHASVMVDFSWTRVDEGTLHTTRVHQDWSDTDGAWQLVRERRAGGDVGNFGERTAPVEPAPRPDVQFATRVIP